MSSSRTQTNRATIRKLYTKYIHTQNIHKLHAASCMIKLKDADELPRCCCHCDCYAFEWPKTNTSENRTVACWRSCCLYFLTNTTITFSPEQWQASRRNRNHHHYDQLDPTKLRILAYKTKAELAKRDFTSELAVHWLFLYISAYI